jgi:CRISPR-associated protein Csx17
MPGVTLSACTATPFGCYLKGLGVLRLVSEQADREARGYWDNETFIIQSNLSADDLATFFVEEYEPTPILGLGMEGAAFTRRTTKMVSPRF